MVVHVIIGKTGRLLVDEYKAKDTSDEVQGSTSKPPEERERVKQLRRGG